MSNGHFLLLAIVMLGLSYPMTSTAQRQPDDEYYPYAEREERPVRLQPDTTLFYRAIQGPADLYGAATGFTLPGVAPVSYTHLTLPTTELV